MQISINNSLKHVYLDLGNKNILPIDGYSSSQSDKQLEKALFNIMKIFNLKNEDFEYLLNETKSGRNAFATNFNYKYSANSVRHYKPLSREYSTDEQKKMLNISPLIHWYNIFWRDVRVA